MDEWDIDLLQKIAQQAREMGRYESARRIEKHIKDRMDVLFYGERDEEDDTGRFEHEH